MILYHKNSTTRRAIVALAFPLAFALVISRIPAATPDLPTTSGEKSGANSAAPGTPGSPDRLREGTKLLNELGTFQRKGGDRYTFRANVGKREFSCLENLSLERIATAVTDNPDSEWVVSGTVTEYRGANCLLVTQAVVKAKSGRAAGL